MEIIDVSKHNGTIDFAGVKAAGVEGVMLRAGYTGWGSYSLNEDPLFENNYAAAAAAGLHVGAYYYSAADTAERARAEAEFFLDRLSGKTFSLPVAFDVENNERQGGLSVPALTDVACTFCEAVERAGYFVSIYASKHWLETKLDWNRISRYDVWLAQWSEKPSYSKPFGMWQYTSGGEVEGVAGRVDRNKAYRDYPSIIREAALNGHGQAGTRPPAPASKYHLGDHVVFSTCYKSSTDPISEAITADKMLRNHGTVTRILAGARNPYLLDDGLCWVNDGDIRGYYGGAPDSAGAIRVGSRVKIKAGAKSYEGKSLASFVYGRTYTVDELKGDRAVLDRKGLDTAVKTSDLTAV